MTAKNFSTTPTIGIFLILSVTGVLLLFHLAGAQVRILHEWLGLAFVVFVFLHVYANWPLMKRYLVGRKALVIAAMLVTATVFAMSPTPSHEEGSPLRSLVIQIKRAPLSMVAKLYEQDVDAWIVQLQTQGYTVAGAEATLADLARDNRIPEEKILALLSRRR